MQEDKLKHQAFPKIAVHTSRNYLPRILVIHMQITFHGFNVANSGSETLHFNYFHNEQFKLFHLCTQ